jgi:crotonobetainyl-CoA:carnitine CoA-transferase CaiB-like acyl-CoA transferase
MDRSRLRTGGVTVGGYLVPLAGCRSPEFFVTDVTGMQDNDELQEHVVSWVAEHPRADVLADLDAHGVVAAPVNRVRDTVTHQRFREGTLVELAGSVLGGALDWAGARPDAAATTPTGTA